MTYHPIATTLLALAALSAPAHAQHAVTTRRNIIGALKNV